MEPAGPVHDGSIPFSRDPKEGGQIGRLVFKVRILGHHVIAGGMGERRAESCAFAPVLRMADQAHAILVTLEDLRGGIRGGKVDDDQLLFRADIRRDHTIEQLRDRSFLVERGDEDAQLHRSAFSNRCRRLTTASLSGSPAKRNESETAGDM